MDRNQHRNQIGAIRHHFLCGVATHVRRGIAPMDCPFRVPPFPELPVPPRRRTGLAQRAQYHAFVAQPARAFA